MGRLWNRAAAALKDQNSVIRVSLARRTALRRPEVEALVIWATSHDESAVDYDSVEKVYRLIRLSPGDFKPLIWAISRRMEKTRSWIVALKGLMLMHGVFSSKVPAVRSIGRLPFDFSNFRDRRSKTWAHNEFVRAYFAFLDQKSAILFINVQERTSSSSPLMQTLDLLQKMQDLLDKTLKIRPESPDAVMPLVIDAMDCVVVEIFEIHSRLCTGIDNILPRVFEAGKAEATAALKIAARARAQGQELNDYFELCNELGVSNASSKPPATEHNKISKEQIQELEDIINGAVSIPGDCSPADQKAAAKEEEQQAKETRGDPIIITDRWETFDEDNVVAGEIMNPYYAPPPLLPLNDNLHLQQRQYYFPDLITF